MSRESRDGYRCARTGAGVASTAPLALLLATSCFGTPTPLSPGVSGSVGLPHHGVLTNGTELPPSGPGFVRYRRHGTAHWGNPRLVRAIESVARQVASERPGGAPLVVGDLSARDGGKIPRHVSHRSGRDVDLSWYVTTPAGAPVLNPGFVNVGPDGLARVESGGYVRLDVERQWLLVKALLTSPDIDVVWMFASRDVEALLVDHARARGEPPDLVWRAATVLMEPADSLAHDDHIHMRIACTPEEAVLGCEGGGPRWEWLEPLPALREDVAFLYDVAREDPLDGSEEPPSVRTPDPVADVPEPPALGPSG